MAGFEDGKEKPFGDVLRGQIKSLREQLDKNKDALRRGAPAPSPVFP